MNVVETYLKHNHFFDYMFFEPDYRHCFTMLEVLDMASPILLKPVVLKMLF